MIWFLLYWAVGAAIVSRALYVHPIGDRPHWSDFLMSVSVPAIMWPLMLEDVFTHEFWHRPAWRTEPAGPTDEELEAGYQETIAIPIGPRPTVGYDEEEREIFGLNDTDAFIRETDHILKNIEWDRITQSEGFRGIVSLTNGQINPLPLGPEDAGAERVEIYTHGRPEPVRTDYTF